MNTKKVIKIKSTTFNQLEFRTNESYLFTRLVAGDVFDVDKYGERDGFHEVYWRK